MTATSPSTAKPPAPHTSGKHHHANPIVTDRLHILCGRGLASCPGARGPGAAEEISAPCGSPAPIRSSTTATPARSSPARRWNRARSRDTGGSRTSGSRSPASRPTIFASWFFASTGTARRSRLLKLRWATSSAWASAGTSSTRAHRSPSAASRRMNCYWPMPFSQGGAAHHDQRRDRADSRLLLQHRLPIGRRSARPRRALKNHLLPHAVSPSLSRAQGKWIIRFWKRPAAGISSARS